jgi:hypothetical protein
MQKISTDNNGIPVYKTFVRDDGHAAIVCPNCQKVRNISVRNFSKRKTSLKVQCSCKQVFKVKLDYRQSYRKPTSLVGTYHLDAPSTGANVAIIKNLSFDGICLELGGIHPIQTGQRGYVDFTLDDKKRTQIKKEFLVQSVSGNKVGCKFKKDQAFDKELGFYLRPGL